MKKYAVLATIALATLMIGSILQMNNPVQAKAKSDIDIVWYTYPDACFSALQAGTVQMMQWPLTKTQKARVEADPNLCLAAYDENGLYELDINNNYTISDCPASLNPMSIEQVRQAIAYLVDKDYVITHVLDGYSSRVDSPVCYPQTERWVNSSVVTYDWNHDDVIQATEDNYPYKYSLESAAALLGNLGFSDTDGNGYLNYPNNPMWLDAAGKDTTLMPLKICIRSDDTNRLKVGRYLWGQLEGDRSVAGDSVLAKTAYWAAHGLVGGDFDTTDNTWEQPRHVLSPIVQRDRNYHIYTGGWSFGRYPTYLYSLFHSTFWGPLGANYVTGEGPKSDSQHDPANFAHPALDELVSDIYYTESITMAQTASLKATGYLVEHCVNIPLWSYTRYTAWRKELVGVVNMKGVSLINDFTFLNAIKEGRGYIIVGIPNTWDTLNPLYSQWYFEYAFLDRCYTQLIVANPYDLSEDLPWAAQDWSVGTWIDPRDGLSKTTVTYYLRKDVGCAAPVTGSFAGYFSAKDYEFTCWYSYAFSDSWSGSSFMDIHHLEIIDPYTVKVYFDATSCWFLYAPTYPLLGPASILTPLLCDSGAAAFHGSDLANPGYASLNPGYKEFQFTHDRIVHVTSATKNGVPLTEGVDFYVRGGYDSNPEHNIFVPLTSFADGDTIVINYDYAICPGASGTYLGQDIGYTWEDTMYCYGTHYPISISNYGASLNKNPYFFLSPLLGEVDWRWYWEGTTKPRNGYFRIGILDVVKCTSCYCTRGDGAYNSLYFPGADIDGTDLGHVGILDLVTITGKYAKRFGSPPS